MTVQFNRAEIVIAALIASLTAIGLLAARVSTQRASHKDSVQALRME